MSWRSACIWSSLALLPMAVLLLVHGSLLGLLYAASAAASVLYHWHRERRFSALDHTLAWAAIGANFWLAWHTRCWQDTLIGALFVLIALVKYQLAHAEPDYYDHHHTHWHLICGAAGLMLVMGYLA